jgi:hypothetical protein
MLAKRPTGPTLEDAQRPLEGPNTSPRAAQGSGTQGSVASPRRLRHHTCVPREIRRSPPQPPAAAGSRPNSVMRRIQSVLRPPRSGPPVLRPPACVSSPRSQPARTASATLWPWRASPSPRPAAWRRPRRACTPVLTPDPSSRLYKPCPCADHLQPGRIIARSPAPAFGRKLTPGAAQTGVPQHHPRFMHETVQSGVGTCAAAQTGGRSVAEVFSSEQGLGSGPTGPVERRLS